MSLAKFRHFSIVTMLLVWVAACTTNPATGEREFTLMTPSQEQSLGSQEHPKLVREFGGEYDDNALTSYVEAIGDDLAAESEMPDTDFSFTVLDSPIVNAFALPGGYVHVSRGLMAYFNDEAEMASVLGHEIGHITARHAANRYTRSVFAGIGGAVVGAVSGSETIGQVVSSGAQLYLLSYSRGQESQADELGLRYMLRGGYDPYGSVRMLETLQTTSQLRALKTGETDQTPNWARTHPLTADRIQDQRSLVQATDVPPGVERNRGRYLRAIDGMIFGDNPEHGVIRGNDFIHPVLRLAFTAPDGFAMQNTATAVVGQDGTSQFLFSGGQISSGLSNRQYLNQVWSDLFDGNPPQALGGIENLTNGGMSGITGATRLNTQNGQLDVRVVAWRFDERHAYHFLLITPPSRTASMETPFQRMTYSFRPISQAEADAIKTRRIRVITVQSGDTVSGLAARMAVDAFAEETFRALNGMEEGDILRVGELRKIIVEE